MIEEIVDKLKPRLAGSPFFKGLSEEKLAHRYQQIQLARLRAERLKSKILGPPIRVAATACWGFPIYSQTFVYQELTQLINAGIDVRFLYSALNAREELPGQFSALWPAKRKMVVHEGVYRSDYEYFHRRMPEKVQQLVDLVCRSSGMAESELRSTYHFRQAFSYTRLVEAYRPNYLHSYFFYEGTLFTLFASYLLDIPRGVSCYADHQLQDYSLKMARLHVEQCRIVIATSARIKRELMALAPSVDPEKILVKPNAINAKRFPSLNRDRLGSEEAFRLTCVSRIEPKKGIVYLVEAVRALLDRNRNVHVHVLGAVDNTPASQEYAREVNRRIQDLNVGEHVHLEGRKSESQILEFLGRSHLFVAPFIETESGDKDGIPTSLLEAMSTGLPAVATDAGSITEVIEDGRNGVLVRQRDAIGLADAIEALLVNPELRRRLGQDAARRIREHFEIGVCEGIFHERVRAVTRRPA